jgi:hypothetical protein
MNVSNRDFLKGEGNHWGRKKREGMVNITKTLTCMYVF